MNLETIRKILDSDELPVIKIRLILADLNLYDIQAAMGFIIHKSQETENELMEKNLLLSQAEIVLSEGQINDFGPEEMVEKINGHFKTSEYGHAFKDSV